MYSRQNGYEAWAKDHGSIDLTLAEDFECNNGWWPATYKTAAAEIGWRAWCASQDKACVRPFY